MWRKVWGEELTEDFRKVGLIHIVVLSGYNVAIILIALQFLLRRFSRRLQFGVGVVSVVLFVLLVGAGATVVRAGIMASIALLGFVTYRTHSAWRALLVAGFCMLVINPYLLLYDLSFQLSFLATLGIIRFSKTWERWLSFLPEKLGVRDVAVATLSTQTAVLPLLLFSIGSISLISPLVNILTLAVIPWAMLLVFLMAVSAMVSAPIATLLSFPAFFLLDYVLLMTEFFADVPFAQIELPLVGAEALLLLYICICVVFESTPVPSQSLTRSLPN